jgi:hypothetical protein
MKLRLIWPLTALLAPSAVSIFAQPLLALPNREPQSNTAQKRVVVTRGRLTGTREYQQVVIWKASVGNRTVARLAIETTGRNPRALWQANERFAASDINNVRVADLDGDRVPEIIGLFWHGGSAGAALRIFHWDPSLPVFAEIKTADGGMTGIQSYVLGGRAGQRRIIVYRTAGKGRTAAGEFEVRGSEVVRLGGGGRVTPQTESGIEGEAVMSPASPGPQRQGQPGSAPYQTTLAVVNTADGREVARIQTGADGRFRVSLPPGEYTIGPSPEEQRRRFPRGETHTVKVVAGRFVSVTIAFDSGMR